jgi:radical SAM superfamily enzyme YgiQ (UPF0313 family)
MTDALLIHLPLSNMIKPPHGLWSIADWLQQRGLTVRLWDMRLYSDRVNGSALAHLIRESRLVGVSLMTMQVPWFLQFVRGLGDLLAGKLVVGGIHPTLFPEQFAGYVEPEHVCSDAGEDFMAALCGRNGERHDITKGKSRDFGLIDASMYRLLGHSMHNPVAGPGHFSVESARGCNGRCAFCINTILPWGQPWKPRPVEAVLDECALSGCNRITFDDEHFFSDGGRAHEIATLLCETVPTARWAGAARVYDVCRYPDLFGRLAREGGLVSLGIGMESGSDRCLKRMHKPHTRAMALDCARILQEAGVYAIYSFIVGVPGEPQPETDEATLDLMREVASIHSNSRFSPPGQPQRFRPYPGTELAQGYTFPESLREWAWVLQNEYEGVDY